MAERGARHLFWFCCCALAVLYAAGCAGTGEPELSSITRDSRRIEPELLFHRAHSDLEEPVRRSIRSQADLSSLLEEALSGEESPLSVEVDFDRSFVTVAGLGTRPTGGFNVAIPDAYVRGDSMFVVVRHTIPGRDCVVPQVRTSPLHAAILPKIAETVRFVVNERTLSCD